MEEDRELSPKEKARDLRANMCLPQGMTGAGAKSCAIIAVNNIIDVLNKYDVIYSKVRDELKHWQEIKEELKKM